MIDHDGPQLLEGASEEETICVADLARSQGFRFGRDNLVTGGDDGDHGAPPHLGPGDTKRGQHSEMSRPDPRPGLEHQGPCLDIAAGGSHRGPDLDRRQNADVAAGGFGVLDHHDRVGSHRDRRPRHDLDGSSGGEVAGGHRARRHLFDNRQRRGCGGHVGGSHRVTVDCAIGEGGEVLGGDDIAREHQTKCLTQRHSLDGKQRRPSQYFRLHLGKRPHAWLTVLS